MTQISSAAEIAAKVEAKRYGFFTLPVLDITIKYRKPDPLKLALNGQLPSMLADQVIKAYKSNIEGTQDQYKKELESVTFEADNNTLKELTEGGYKLFSDLCVSHVILDCDKSDFASEVISWKDIPEEDALAFMFYILNSSNTAETGNGGEVSSIDIATFPDGKRRKKRSTVR